MTKLDDRKIRFLCRARADNKDWTNGQIAAQYGITKRRVQQLVAKYRRTGAFPTLNRSRRPKGPPLSPDERRVIDEIWEEKRLGARLLYQELKKRGYRIAHNKIAEYLRRTGRSIPNPRKQRKRKRCRYEREHSFSLVHGDWHRTALDKPHAIVWLDDASRLALAGGEFPESSMDLTIETFKKAELAAWALNAAIREVNTDRGSEFFSNHPDSLSRFQTLLLERGIKHIVSRKSNPQTNGKLERFWYEYDKHRWRFADIDQFLNWYNDRIHGALWLEFGETPKEAVIRKLPPECLLGLFMGWADGGQ